MAVETVSLLNNNAWLNTLPGPVKAELIGAAKIRHFSVNQRVHSKGDKGDGLYCVLNGELRVSATTFYGNEFVFTRILPGSWFGEIGILDDGPRTHDAYSVDDCEIAIIPAATIRALCERNKPVYQALVVMLCTHCRRAFDAIDQLLIYSNEQRLANLIISRIAENHHPMVKFSQQELGAQIGISRQSINKILKDWQARGWIIRVYRGLEVIDMKALKACLIKSYGFQSR